MSAVAEEQLFGAASSNVWGSSFLPHNEGGEYVFYADDYVNPGGKSLVAGDVNETTANENADVIIDVIDRVCYEFLNLEVGEYGGVLNRKLTARIVFRKGLYQIAKPIEANQQGLCISLDFSGGALVNWHQGPSSSDFDKFETTYPGRWAIEFGSRHNENTCPMFLTIENLTLSGFSRGIQLGTAPNNINCAKYTLRNIDFVGPNTLVDSSITSGSDAQKLLFRSKAVRIFNRSATVLIDRCSWTNYLTAVEVQSADLVKVENPRVQMHKVHMNPTSDGLSSNLRDEDEGVFVHYDGRLDIRWGCFNPAHESSVSDSATKKLAWVVKRDWPDWVASTPYKVGDIVWAPGVFYSDQLSSIVDSSRPILYVCVSNHTSSSTTFQGDYGVADSTWNSGKWMPVDCFLDWVEGANAPDDIAAGGVVRRVINGEDYFYATSVAVAKNTAWNSANWQKMCWQGSASTSYKIRSGIQLVGSVQTRLEYAPPWVAGQPISAWDHVTITDETLFGAESGGFTPVYWKSKSYRYKTTDLGDRKQRSKLRIANCTIAAKIEFENVEQPSTHKFVPAVLMAGRPDRLEIVDNDYAYQTRAVAAMWDPDAAPESVIASKHYFKSMPAVDIRGNAGGATGIEWFGGAGYPHASSYQYYGANWVPDELTMPFLPFAFTTTNPTSAVVAMPSSGAYVHKGEVRRDANTGELWMSRAARLVGTWGPSEEKYWIELAATDYETHAYTGVPGVFAVLPPTGEWFQWAPPEFSSKARAKIKAFYGFEHGRRIYIYCHNDYGLIECEANTGLYTAGVIKGNGTDINTARGKVIGLVSVGGQALCFLDTTL